VSPSSTGCDTCSPEHGAETRLRSRFPRPPIRPAVAGGPLGSRRASVFGLRCHRPTGGVAPSGDPYRRRRAGTTDTRTPRSPRPGVSGSDWIRPSGTSTSL